MKLAPKKISRKYELTYLLPVVFTDSELKKFKEDIQKLLEKKKATDVVSEDWGKKHLAYKIKFSNAMQAEAFYVHVTFKADPKIIASIERELHLNDQVMRHLIVVADEKANKVVQEKAPAEKAAEKSE